MYFYKQYNFESLLIIIAVAIPCLIGSIHGRSIQYSQYNLENDACPEGNYYDKLYNRCRSFPGGGKVVHIDHRKRCSNNYLGAKVHPNYSQYYYVCKKDSVIFGKCPIDQIFNSAINHCAQYSSNESEEEENLPKCRGSGRFPITSNCSLFYICDSMGHYYLKKLHRCPGSMVFCPFKQKCSYTYRCIPTEINPYDYFDDDDEEVYFPACQRPGRYRSTTDCSLYYTCSAKTNGKFYQTRHKCPPGTLYDLEKGKCRHKEQVKCNFITIESLLEKYDNLHNKDYHDHKKICNDSDEYLHTSNSKESYSEESSTSPTQSITPPTIPSTYLSTTTEAATSERTTSNLLTTTHQITTMSNKDHHTGSSEENESNCSELESEKPEEFTTISSATTDVTILQNFTDTTNENSNLSTTDSIIVSLASTTETITSEDTDNHETSSYVSIIKTTPNDYTEDTTLQTNPQEIHSSASIREEESSISIDETTDALNVTLYTTESFSTEETPTISDIEDETTSTDDRVILTTTDATTVKDATDAISSTEYFFTTTSNQTLENLSTSDVSANGITSTTEYSFENITLLSEESVPTIEDLTEDVSENLSSATDLSTMLPTIIPTNSGTSSIDEVTHDWMTTNIDANDISTTESSFESIITTDSALHTENSVLTTDDLHPTSSPSEEPKTSTNNDIEETKTTDDSNTLASSDATNVGITDATTVGRTDATTVKETEDTTSSDEYLSTITPYLTEDSVLTTEDITSTALPYTKVDLSTRFTNEDVISSTESIIPTSNSFDLEETTTMSSTEENASTTIISNCESTTDQEIDGTSPTESSINTSILDDSNNVSNPFEGTTGSETNTTECTTEQDTTLVDVKDETDSSSKSCEDQSTELNLSTTVTVPTFEDQSIGPEKTGESSNLFAITVHPDDEFNKNSNANNSSTYNFKDKSVEHLYLHISKPLKLFVDLQPKNNCNNCPNNSKDFTSISTNSKMSNPSEKKSIYFKF